MLQANGIVAKLDSLGRERSLLKHPFYQDWTAGALSMQRLRNYAVQYYRHVAAFPRYLSALHSRCDDLPTRQVLLENLIDEERGSENHPELWLRFAEAIGLARQEVVGAGAQPAADALVETFDHLSRELPLEAGLAALYVYESQVRDVADAKIDGLKRFYGVTDVDGVKFFTVHREADVYHCRAVAQLIERRGGSEWQNRTMMESGSTALDALWRTLDSV